MYIFCMEGTNDANCPHEVIVISNGYDHQLILNKALLIEPVSLFSVTLLLYVALSLLQNVSFQNHRFGRDSITAK